MVVGGGVVIVIVVVDKLTSSKLNAWISRDQERALVDVPRTMDLCQVHQSRVSRGRKGQKSRKK